MQMFYLLISVINMPEFFLSLPSNCSYFGFLDEIQKAHLGTAFFLAVAITLPVASLICNTSYPPRHFVVSKLQTGGLYAQKARGRIEARLKLVLALPLPWRPRVHLQPRRLPCGGPPKRRVDAGRVFLRARRSAAPRPLRGSAECGRAPAIPAATPVAPEQPEAIRSLRDRGGSETAASKAAETAPSMHARSMAFLTKSPAR